MEDLQWSRDTPEPLFLSPQHLPQTRDRIPQKVNWSLNNSNYVLFHILVVQDSGFTIEASTFC